MGCTQSEKMNAQNDRRLTEFSDTGERMNTEKGVRAVVLSGEGGAFCAGLEMGNVGKKAESDDDTGSKSNKKRNALAPRTHGLANRAQYAAWVWREVPVPVIAAVHGVAFGGGFQVCLGADIRYVAPDTKMSIMEIKWGLVPDMAGTQLMRHLAREDIVRELTYTGRIFSGEEALDYGFATRVVDDPRALALETAKEIAGKNPDAIRANKRIFNAAPYVDAGAGLLTESVEQDEIIGSANQVESIMSTMEKRPGKFADA